MDPIITLSDQYRFKEYCCLTSIEIFDEAEAQNAYPSRSRFVAILFKDTCSSPIYLLKKVGEIVLYTLNPLLNAQGGTPLLGKSVKNIIEKGVDLALLLTIPILNVAVRMTSAAIGVLIPQLGLKGWKIAEMGDSLFYRLWCKNPTEPIDPTQMGLRKAYAEIVPANAIFYLGNTTARRLARKIDKEELNATIQEKFTEFLTAIYEADKECFRDLLRYDQKFRVCQPRSYLDHPVTPSHPIEKILPNVGRNFADYHELEELNKKLEENRKTPEEEHLSRPNLEKELLTLQEECLLKLDAWMMEEVETMNIKHLHQLFDYICFFLESPMILKKLPPEIQEIEPQVTELKNLFSKRLGFGRANFLTPLHGLDAHEFPRL